MPASRTAVALSVAALTFAVALIVVAGVRTDLTQSAPEQDQDTGAIPAVPGPPATPPPSESEGASPQTLNMSLQEAMYDYLDKLAGAGGGEFAGATLAPQLFSLLIRDLSDATGVVAYGTPGNLFPAGYELASMTPEERARWRTAGEPALQLLQEQLEIWGKIEAALDASPYQHPELDELSGLLRTFFTIDAHAYRDLVALTTAGGAEALASREAMQRLSQWLPDTRRGDLARGILAHISDSGVTVDEDLEALIGRAIANVRPRTAPE
jgi:hypothetical protein